ncbi:MAG: DUF126 domain-containing protein [Candidatus Heimdallarchaeota archaeon]|nr:DUF126 domain-containing protein [Candidatus Heimdallarchaeota archaeon]
MTKEFKGRAIFPGKTSGKVIVSHRPLNTLATYKNTIVFKKKKAIGGDQDNQAMYKKDLTKKIICLPQTSGSTTGGLALMSLAENENAPSALLFSKSIDSLAAAGVILADVWIKKRIITVDRLGDDFLKYIKTDMKVEIREDGTVIILD